MVWSSAKNKYVEDENDRLVGRCRHTTCVHGQKIITFGGCFMYNSKRQVRENTNQLLVYDIKTNQ